MSLIQLRTSFFCTCLAFVFFGFAASAQSWVGKDWRSPLGLHTASIAVKKHEFALQITCNEAAQESLKLSLVFSGPALPRLYGTDGQEETLLLSFDASESTSIMREWNAHYFDGGIGDQAWLGDTESDNEMLDAFSRAKTISILNVDKELIYRFPAKGTSAGTKLLRDTCGLGSSW
jgi:hypothetical protein